MTIKEAINHPVFKKISQIAEQEKSPCFVIGGFVRDYLLGKKNAKDIDIVTQGSGIDLAQAFANSLGEKVKVSIFKNFGTAMIKYRNIDIEFVGARKESYQRDSRKPIVENGTLEDDQNRRDFTINTMAISLQSDSYGELIDPFEGVKDLEKKIIKTPLNPDITFSDDPLRMMRAIRFANQLDFLIDENCLESIKKNKNRMVIVSMERIMDEFNKIMQTQKPSVGLLLLNETGLLHYILPELTALQGIDENEGKTHKDNFYHTLEVVDNICENTDNIWLRWAALLHDIGKAQTKKIDKKNGWSFHNHEFIGAKMVPKIFRRLKLPLGQDMKFVAKMVMMSSRPIAVVDDNATDSAVRRLLFDAGEEINDLFTLCNADITTKNPDKIKKYKENFIKVQVKIKEVEERDRVKNWQPPIDGEEIMKIFDLKPGREIGILKNAIKEAILDGKIENSYNSAYDFMINQAKKLNLHLKN